MNPKNYVLYSGGAQGSEAEFGTIAEKFGVQEVNFTFDGHKIFRTRGVRVLTTEELLKGDVSLAYLSILMNRKYNTDIDNIFLDLKQLSNRKKPSHKISPSFCCCSFVK